MKLEEAQNWLAVISYKNYNLSIEEKEDKIFLVCVRIDEDSITGIKDYRTTREIMNIDNMDATAFVHKVFGYLLGLAQHEVCEFFKFRDVAIFNPHASVFTLQYAFTPTLNKLL